jgi:5-formyltetrahydrofolate cyclo-ligase
MGNDVTSTTSARKQLMRRDAIARRRTVGNAERAEAGETLIEQAATLLPDQTTNSGDPARTFAINFNQATDGTQRRQHSRCEIPTDTVAAYISMGSEVPTIPLLEYLCKHGRRVLVPRLGSGRDIGWSEYDGQESLRSMPRTATGGIRPQEPSGKTLTAEAIEDALIVFVPAFAIDLDGNRLGRGGGWYDHALRLCQQNAVKIGVCWDWELIESHEAVPHETHDIPVDAVATPERFLWLRHR